MIQEIIDHALSVDSFSVNKRSVVVAVTGLMGSGKTTLVNCLSESNIRRRKMGNHRTSSSTRVINNRVFRMHPFRESDTEFMLPFRESDTELIAYENICDFPLPVYRPLVTTKPAFSSKLSSLTQQMIHTIQAFKHTLELVHMIDTGGQPELMELMPSLVHNVNLVILVHNLMYHLEEHQPVSFRRKGVTFKRCSSSQYTGRQMFLKLASTLQAKKLCRDAKSPFRLLVVATHSDCVGNNLKARVAALNRELKSLLLPAFKEELILYKDPGEIPFVLNLKHPNIQDKYNLEQILIKISDPCLGETSKEPGSFFMFERDLVGYAAKLGRYILSFHECMQVGEKLGMNAKMVQASLALFHRQNTFLYFQNVLPNHIFLKPKFLLECINSIVEFSYRIGDGDLEGFPNEFVPLLKDGIITEEMLKLSTGFIPGFYEACHVIKLFTHTFNIVPLSQEIQQSKATKEESVPCDGNRYLLMCLLPAIPDLELRHHIPVSSVTAPLVVKFSTNCVPIGCFSSTISCLLSTYNWSISRKGDGTRECLAHNIAYLRAPNLPIKIVLIEQTEYLEIHITASISIACSASSICSQVRTTIFNAIGKVFEIMQLTEIKISSAVFCPCHTVHKSHLATFSTYANQLQFLLCSQSKSEVEPDSKHLLWVRNDVTLQGSPCPPVPELQHQILHEALAIQAQPSLQSTTITTQQPSPVADNIPFKSDEPTMQQLLSFQTKSNNVIRIMQRIASEYRSLCVKLLEDNDGGITKAIMAENHHQTDDIVHTILSRWLQGKGRKPVTWATFIAVLYEIELSRLAQEIDENILHIAVFLGHTIINHFYACAETWVKVHIVHRLDSVKCWGDGELGPRG